MTEDQQRQVIQKPDFFTHVRDRLKAILVADFSYTGFLTMSIDGIHVEFEQEGADAHLKVGQTDADQTVPIYEWTAPISWMGVV